VADQPIITVPDMETLLAGGDALALLPEGVPGPVQLGGEWWAVPTGTDAYQPVADAAAVELLDRLAARYATARAAARRARHS
jgi:hypothetical protein